MATVTDHEVERRRDGAAGLLRQASGNLRSAIAREKTTADQARFTIGYNHHLGDQVVADMCHAIKGSEKALAAVIEALSCVGQIDVMREESGYEQ